MGDTVDIPVLNGTAKISTKEASLLNGVAVAPQHVQRAAAAIVMTDGSVIDIPGDATHGQMVDVTRLPAVALDGPTLAALESITVTVANPSTATATEGTLAAVLAAVDGLEGNTTGLATQTTLAAVLAKLTADPSTATAQATQATKLDTLHTDLAAVLAKLIAAPATEATLATLAKSDVAAALTDARKIVPTPGTVVALAASTPCKWVTVSALLSNTDQVNVGGSGALATSGGSTGTPLSAGSSVTIPVDNVSKVFVDARVAGEGVSYTIGA